MSLSSHHTRELFTGVIYKCGGKVKSWNKRWLVLRSDYCLYYYKDTAKSHLGVISLRDPKFKVRAGEKTDCTWPKQCKPEARLALVTSPRTYFIYTDSESEAEDWKRVLSSARDNLVKDSYASNRLLSGRSATSVSSDDAKPKDQSRKSSVPAIPTSECSSTTTEPESYEQMYSSPLEENVFKFPSSPVRKSTEGVFDKMEERVEAFYDTAKAEFVRSNSAVYDDVAFERSHGKSNGKPNPSADATGVLYEEPPQSPEQDVYEEPPDTPARSKAVPIQVQESMVYELLGSPIQSLPLPPIPIAQGNGTTDQQPVYEEMHGAVLYEDIDTSNVRIKDTFEASVSIEDDTHHHAPLLPPKDDGPPLPPRYSDAPELPARNSSPSPPPKHDSPPLPPKEDSNTPPLPSKEHSNTPPLPPKEDSNTPPLPSKEHSNTPPLPPKEDSNTPPLPSKEHSNTPPLPSKEHSNTPPLPHKEDSKTAEHTAKKPIPRHRNITPSASPEPVRRRSPSPKPRRAASPVPVPRSRSPVPRKRTSSPVQTQQRTGGGSDSPTTSKRAAEGLMSNGRGSPGKTQTERKGVKIKVTPPSVRRHEGSAVRNGHSDDTSSEAKRSPSTSATPPAKEVDKGGMALFRKRHERVQEVERADTKQRAHTMQILDDVSADPKLSVHDKGLFAETLREVEQERLKASEERFHWERERMKFEDERRKFEEEKKRLMVELDRTREQVQQS